MPNPLPIPRVGPREACEILGCSYRSIINPNWRRRHQIPTYRVGKSLVFCPLLLQQWLDAHREQPLPSEEKGGNAA